MKLDSICGMEVAEDTKYTAEHNGELHYFCSAGCRDLFLDGLSQKGHSGEYDLVIIGAGPAGLTAAVYASLLKIHTFLIGGDIGGQAIDSTKIENYMGYDLITGPELVLKFQQQLLQNHYVSHSATKAESVVKTGEGFRITASDSKQYNTTCIIVATGMSRRRLNIPGEEQFQRKGVFYGNVQDYAFVQNKNAVVVGGGNSALQIVENLHKVARKVVLLSDFDLSADAALVERMRSFDNLEIWESCTVELFQGESTIGSVVFRQKAASERVTVSADGVFISIGLGPNSGLVSDLVDRNEKNEIAIHPDCSTSCNGLFAAGDVTDAFGKRIVIAAGEGAKAALAVKKYLMSAKKIKHAKTTN